eukprot:995886-Pyramimonas_sp.AAC.1
MDTAFSGEEGELRNIRVLSLFQYGVALHTDFSGMQGAEAVMLMIKTELKKVGLDNEWLMFYRATEPIP